MAELTPRERLQPCLLDRLRDDRPEQKQESREQRVVSAAELRACVVRDLEWLLNCTQRWPDEAALDAGVAASVLNYGIPDLAGTLLSGIDAAVLERRVRAALLAYEPRLDPQSLRVSVDADAARMDRRALTFTIESEMWAQPLPLTLYMKTEVDLETGRTRLAGRG